jgi:hypothetical protein
LKVWNILPDKYCLSLWNGHSTSPEKSLQACQNALMVSICYELHEALKAMLTIATTILLSLVLNPPPFDLRAKKRPKSFRSSS